MEAAASERGLTLSEWCREVLLGKVNGQPTKADPSGAAQALMAELVALRTILLNVLFKQANGESLTGRVAHPSPLRNVEGAPSFAFFAKGGIPRLS